MNVTYKHQICIDHSEDGRRYSELVEDWLKDMNTIYEKKVTSSNVTYTWSEDLTMRFEGERK